MTPNAATYVRVSTSKLVDASHSLTAQAGTPAASANWRGYIVVCQYLTGDHSGAKQDWLTPILFDLGVGLLITTCVEDLSTGKSWRHLP